MTTVPVTLMHITQLPAIKAAICRVSIIYVSFIQVKNYP
jgi:hypothetical protein